MAVGLTEIFAPATTASVATFTNTFTGSAEIGDTVFILFVSSSSGTLNTPTDSVGNTYSLPNQLSASTNLRAALAVTTVTNRIVGGSTTFACSTSGLTAKGVAASKLVNNQWNMKVTLDRTGNNSAQTSATPTTGTTGTLNNSHELVFAVYGWNSADTFAEPTGYTNPHGAGVKITTPTTVVSMAAAYLEVFSATALNPTPTLGASISCGGCAATFTVGKDALLINNYQFVHTTGDMWVAEAIR